MAAYEPTVWAKGDKITAAKLNKLEQAVAALSEDDSEPAEPAEENT